MKGALKSVWVVRRQTGSSLKDQVTENLPFSVEEDWMIEQPFTLLRFHLPLEEPLEEVDLGSAPWPERHPLVEYSETVAWGNNVKFC